MYLNLTKLKFVVYYIITVLVETGVFLKLSFEISVPCFKKKKSVAPSEKLKEGYISEKYGFFFLEVV